MTEIPGVELRSRGLYLRDHRTLVVADLHIGRGFSAGVELPVDDAVTIDTHLEALLEHWNPRQVVLAGDVLDAFQTVPPGVQSRLESLIESIAACDASLEVLAGNHDVLLPSLVDETVRDDLRLGETIIAHGQAPVQEDAERYIVGHQHPAVRIEGVKRPCYLVGPAPNGGTVIVLPAFSPALRGTVMNRRRECDIDDSLLPDGALDRFRPVVWDAAAEEALWFPAFANLRPFL